MQTTLAPCHPQCRATKAPAEFGPHPAVQPSQRAIDASRLLVSQSHEQYGFHMHPMLRAPAGSSVRILIQLN